MKKYNVIIDTDPGVDDSIAIIPALFEKKLNIRLFTTVSGNVDLKQDTKNLLHILEFYKKDIPVAKGAEKPLVRERKHAHYIHGPFGTGKYVIPQEPTRKVIEKDAVEAMYETICKYKNDIILLLIAPTTNTALLFQKHPNVKSMISEIIVMGTSAYGMKKNTPLVKERHISFNSSSDPEALKIVLESGIKVTIVPSEIGRSSHLHKEQVEKIKKNKLAGEMLYEMLDGYWEPNITPPIVAMNDSCAVLYLTHPKVFKTKRADVKLDVDKNPGKTVYKFNDNGKHFIVTDINVKKFHKAFFNALKHVK